MKMAQNEKIRTEDVIEILDGRILTTEGHVEIGVLPRENYSSVMTKIAQRVLTEGQKDAFDASLTTPSALNPVVLKNDLTTYVPQWDLGSIRDSVTYKSELPLPFTAQGTTSDGSRRITNLNTFLPIGSVMGRGKVVTSTFFPVGTTVVDIVSGTEVQTSDMSTVALPDDVTVGTETMTFSPLVGELRGVIEDRIIYRWTGSEWTPFTRTGTLDHTELLNQNGGSQYQHLTQAQKDTILATSHSHSNKSVLDAIISAGSGHVITTAERAALPTAKQKEALAGTSGVPSASNPYVTNADPRLNAARNPYVTIGPPGSLATFQGVDFNPFNDAIQAIDIGSASTVKAIEVLAGNYNLGGVSLIWSTQSSSLLMENFTPMTTILSFFNIAWGIQALLTGGPLILRGFIFELNEEGTSGVFSTREHTIIEDCVFRPGLSAANGQKGIALFGAGSIIRRCKFLKSSSNEKLQNGITINAPNCRIENCTFDVGANSGVKIAAGGDYAIVDHCTFLSGHIEVGADVKFTNIVNNRFYGVYAFKTTPKLSSSGFLTASGSVLDTIHITNDLVSGSCVKFIGTLPPLVDDAYYFVRNRTATTFQLSRLAGGAIITFPGLDGNAVYSGSFSLNAAEDAVTDDGVGTRCLENMPQDINQPFIGRRRTLGPTGTYADYRDNTEVPFLAALNDTNVTEVEVLEGTYTFSSTVTIPAGKSIKGVRGGLKTSGLISGVIIQGAAGITPFALEDKAGLENLVIRGTNTSLVTGASVSGVNIRGCRFELATVSLSQYEIEATSPTDWRIDGCTFAGTRGVSLSSSIRTRLINCVFENSAMSLSMSASSKDHIKSNHFYTTAAPVIAGDILLVENNEFLGSLPTKLATTSSIWQGNWPHPSANNDAGVDTLDISLDRYLEPNSEGVTRSTGAIAGTIKFDAGVLGVASTLPIAIPAKVDKTKPFTVNIYWTAPAGATGDVVWRVTAVFRDRVSKYIGTSVVSSPSLTSTRTVGSAITEEDLATVTFSNYGMGTKDPTHFSITVERMGTLAGDNITVLAVKSAVHLTEVQVLLPRD